MAQITFEFNWSHNTTCLGCQSKGMPKQRDVTANGDVKAMGCQSNIGDPSLVTFGGGRPMRQNWRQDSTLENDMWYGGRILGGRIMKRMMSWTPTPSHLMKQMPRKRGPRHKGLESTKWNDEISYLGSEKLMSFWAIFLVLHFASLICGNPLFGCYKGGNVLNHIIYLHCTPTIFCLRRKDHMITLSSSIVDTSI